FLVEQLDALAVRPAGVGARAVAGAAELHPPRLLGGAAADVAGRLAAARAITADPPPETVPPGPVAPAPGPGGTRRRQAGARTRVCHRPYGAGRAATASVAEGPLCRGPTAPSPRPCPGPCRRGSTSAAARGRSRLAEHAAAHPRGAGESPGRA